MSQRSLAAAGTGGFNNMMMNSNNNNFMALNGSLLQSSCRLGDDEQLSYYQDMPGSIIDNNNSIHGSVI